MTYKSPYPTRAKTDRSTSGNSSVSGGASVVSTYSVTSSFRHHNSPFSTPTPSTPKPVLTSDSNRKPKTRGSFGLMVVGIGGANGTTLLAGLLANRLKLEWRGPQGQPMLPNYNGCITQLNQKGKFGGVGFKDRLSGLPNASMAAVGGWVSTKPHTSIILILFFYAENVLTQIHNGMDDLVFVSYCSNFNIFWNWNGLCCCKTWIRQFIKNSIASCFIGYPPSKTWRRSLVGTNFGL